MRVFGVGSSGEYSSGKKLRVKALVTFNDVMYFHPGCLVNWLPDGQVWIRAWKELRLEGPASQSERKD